MPSVISMIKTELAGKENSYDFDEEEKDSKASNRYEPPSEEPEWLKLV